MLGIACPSIDIRTPGKGQQSRTYSRPHHNSAHIPNDPRQRGATRIAGNRFLDLSCLSHNGFLGRAPNVMLCDGRTRQAVELA